jgi:hypothetical protein
MIERKIDVNDYESDSNTWLRTDRVEPATGPFTFGQLLAACTFIGVAALSVFGFTTFEEQGHPVAAFVSVFIGGMLGGSLIRFILKSGK